jgi:hypothetical protein
MPKPKANTDFKIGSDGIFPPLIDKFFQERPAPPAWGTGETRWRRAFFLAEVAVDPAFLDKLYQSTSPVDFPHYYDYFVELFPADPDYFCAFVAYIRSETKVRTYLAVAKGFLREGAVDRFKEKESREPSDKELSWMIKQEHGVNVAAEYFGDARRGAIEEDQKMEHTVRELRKPSGDIG